MATKKPTAPTDGPLDLAPVLREVAQKLAKAQALRQGTIHVRTIEAGGQSYYLEASDRGVEVVKEPPTQTPPVIEIIGDARIIQEVLGGRSDATHRYLTGGFRVRGDLRYLSDLALELGFIKVPL